VQYPHDLHPVIQRAIKDHITTKWDAAQPRYKLIASAAHQRVRGEQLAVLFHSLHQLGTVARIIAGDEVANFDDIALGMLAED